MTKNLPIGYKWWTNTISFYSKSIIDYEKLQTLKSFLIIKSSLSIQQACGPM